MVDDRKMPGGGTMVKGLAKCSEKDPIVVGKPNPTALNLACEKFGLQKDKCLMVGDRLDTDMMMGFNAKVDSFLVLCGVTSEETMREWNKTHEQCGPTYYEDDLS